MIMCDKLLEDSIQDQQIEVFLCYFDCVTSEHTVVCELWSYAGLNCVGGMYGGTKMCDDIVDVLCCSNPPFIIELPNNRLLW